MSWLKPGVHSLLAVLALLAGAQAAGADSYRVCYLPPDEATKVISFCPASPTASAECSCQDAAGVVATLAISNEAALDDMVCAVKATGSVISLCPPHRSGARGVCSCGSRRGSVYGVNMTARYNLRGNPAAQADFLKRLKECCIQKP